MVVARRRDQSNHYHVIAILAHFDNSALILRVFLTFVAARRRSAATLESTRQLHLADSVRMDALEKLLLACSREKSRLVIVCILSVAYNLYNDDDDDDLESSVQCEESRRE